mgnify:CR=1 FL=1
MGSFQPGYALLLGAMIAVLALYRFRRRQREPAGRGVPFRPSPAPSARFSDVAANDEAMESLRDVLAFPKIQNGACLMMETPSAVQPEQLEQLKIRCVE